MDLTVLKREWTIPELLIESKRLQTLLPPLFTWKYLLDAANICDLGVFHRHPTLLDLYTFEFTPTVIRDHGSVEKYLIKSLGEWNHLPESEIVWNRKLETKIKLNDWPYALPREVIHWVIWVPLPVAHESLCDSNSTWTWEDVSRQGLAGFTGLSAQDKEVYTDSGGVNGPGKEISAFVKEHWKEEEFETLWYVNPPRLQSVRGLAHFHVLARPQTQL